MLRLSLYKYAMCLEELGHEEEARQVYRECLEVAKQSLAHPIRTGRMSGGGNRCLQRDLSISRIAR